MTHAKEVQLGSRFAFGENWRRFLHLVDETRLGMAVSSLTTMLNYTDLHRKSFLDIGSGSGLFSLAARKLGARVHSLDYDPQSVTCTRELKHRYYPDCPEWVVETGSVLDANYIDSLGQWDVVYSWGVLHHTGNMWQACAHVADLVKPGGQLYIAIYNDQGRSSRIWLTIKRFYNRAPLPLKWVVLVLCALRLRGPSIVRDTLRGSPLRSWREYACQSRRGMSAWRDIVDWVGGLPFEVAKPEQLFEFYRVRGFSLEKMITCAGGLGCNEFVFRKKCAAASDAGVPDDPK